jgi:hypothetical protein
MNDDDRFWLNLRFGLVAGVFFAAAGALFQRGSRSDVLIGAGLLIAFGLIGISLARAKVHGRIPRLWSSSAGRRIVAAAILAIASLVGAYFAWSIWPDDPPSTEAPAKPADGRTRMVSLVSQITGREWVLEGESCQPDSMRFRLEGNELVAYPKESPPMRHSIVKAAGDRVTTQVDGRTVEFLFRGDRFAYVDEGVERWFHGCE